MVVKLAFLGIILVIAGIQLKSSVSSPETQTGNVRGDNNNGNEEINVVRNTNMRTPRQTDLPKLPPQKIHRPPPIPSVSNAKFTSPRHIPTAQRLLIGGSDGSGTRSVVKLCQDLGVEMVIDDYGTYDVHGQEMVGGKGWPEVVKPVVRETANGNYDWDSLSSKTRGFLEREIGRMNSAHERKVRHNGKVDDVTYGIKAPVSMLLVPVFRKIWGGMKFIHVVRDGRDIAFSGNQSPVGKFYESFYRDADERRTRWSGEVGVRVNGIQLWSDWNTQVRDYSERAANEVGSDYDYIVIRLEDLLDSNKRYGVIKSVATFLGSRKTDSELCRMAKEGVKDMGSHTRGNKPSDVKKRYGKWHGPLAQNPSMSKEVHEQGGKGLATFGYEPDIGIGDYDSGQGCV